MRYHKTDKARDALSGNGQPLSALQRRVLILCDGTRDGQSLTAMLGMDVTDTLQVLVLQGFLVPATPAQNQSSAAQRGSVSAKLAGLAGGLGKLWGRQGTQSAVPSTAAPTPQRVDTVVSAEVPLSPATPVQANSTQSIAIDLDEIVAPPTRSPRRSLAACKMYLLDMLQLQRNMEASALAVDIQTSVGETELVRRIFQTLVWLHGNSKPGVFARIAERVSESMPEGYLLQLQQVCSQLQQPGAASPQDGIELAK